MKLLYHDTAKRYARMLKDYCEKHKTCDKCAFCEDAERVVCKLRGEAPTYWKVDEE